MLGDSETLHCRFVTADTHPNMRTVVVATLLGLLRKAACDTDIAWTITTYSDETASIGDAVTFTWTGNHDVYLHSSGGCTESDDDTLVGSSSPATYTFDAAGDYTFACEVGSHCENGQMILFTVSASSTSSPTSVPIPSPTPVQIPSPAFVPTTTTAPTPAPNAMSTPAPTPAPNAMSMDDGDDTMSMDDGSFVEGSCVADVGYPMYSTVAMCESMTSMDCHVMNISRACALAMPNSGASHSVGTCSCYSATSVVSGCAHYFMAMDDGMDDHAHHDHRQRALRDPDSRRLMDDHHMMMDDDAGAGTECAPSVAPEVSGGNPKRSVSTALAVASTLIALIIA